MDATLLVVMVAWFAGSFVSGVSGLGAALVAVPVLAFFLPMKENILLSCLVLATLDSFIFLQHRHFCRPWSALRLMVGIVPGTLAGVLVLEHVPERGLEAAVGLLLLLFLAWECRTKTQARGRESWLWGGLVGTVASMTGAAISMGGPPVAAYGLRMGWEPRVYLGTLGLFYGVRAIAACVAQASHGMYTPTVLYYYFWTLPAVLLSSMLALHVVRHISRQRFRRVVCAVLAVGGVACLARAVIG